MDNKDIWNPFEGLTDEEIAEEILKAEKEAEEETWKN